MCLYADKEKTEELKKQSEIVAYKVIYRSPFDASLFSPYYGHTWKPGWNKAVIYDIQKYEIEEGIHVYLEEKDATNVAVRDYYWRVMKVKCKTTDMIAAGRPKFDAPCNQAVFTKVFLEESEYKRVINCTNKEAA